jgi:glycosyltransferase involved in cell wall biosynthesis
VFYVSEGKDFPRNIDVKPLYPEIFNRLYYSRFHDLANKIFPRHKWTDKNFRKLVQSNVDIIHIHNFHGQYATIQSLAYLASKKTVVWTFHRAWGFTGGCDQPFDCLRYQDACGDCPQVNMWPVGPVDRTAEQLKLKLHYLANAPIHIIAPSRGMAREIKESQVGRNWPVRYIPNGVDPSKFGYKRKRDYKFRETLGIGPKTTVILIANRNFKSPVKGYDMILESLSKINPAGIHLILAGIYSDWAAEQVPTGFKYSSFGYVSSREEMASLYEVADIFLFASPYENFPCVVLEAMSAKCCIVSTPTDGVLEQVENRVSGLLAESISGESLAGTLQEALDHEDMWKVLGENARKRIESEFTEGRMISQHLGLYRNLVEKH